MRQFNLVVLDDSDLIVDRFNLPYVTNIGGLGYELTLYTIETDIKDYVTKTIQQKRNITLTLIHTNKYLGYDNFLKWVQKNHNNTICLEYINDVGSYYCEGKVVSTSFDELNIYRVLNNTITFRPLTPFFKKIENKIRIQRSSEGKYYPLAYPYCYGNNMILDNEINNTYFTDVPVIITIYGTITNPHIVLTDSNGNIYNEVEFDNVFVDEDEKIIINSAQKKIWFIDALGNKSDYYYKINDAYDSYLRAKPSDISSVNINFEVTDSGYLIGSWRQYTL